MIWRLPQLPVSMDGRTNVHGADNVARSIYTWSGSPEWVSDSELKAAGVVIGPINTALSSILRLDDRYELVYEDDVAAVFVASLP